MCPLDPNTHAESSHCNMSVPIPGEWLEQKRICLSSVTGTTNTHGVGVLQGAHKNTHLPRFGNVHVMKPLQHIVVGHEKGSITLGPRVAFASTLPQLARPTFRVSGTPSTLPLFVAPWIANAQQPHRRRALVGLTVGFVRLSLWRW